MKGRFRKLGDAVSLKALVAVLVWGTSFAATRIALEGLTSWGLVAVRSWAGALLLGAIIRVRGERWLPSRADWSVCTFLGLVLAAHLLLQAHGLSYTTAINTGWIVGFIPVTIAIGAFLFRQQRLRCLGWLGVLMGTCGILIVTVHNPPDFRHAWWGNLLAIVSCLTWTIYTLVATGPIARNGVLCVTSFGMVVAALITSGAAAFMGMRAGALTASVIAALAFLGPLCSGVAYHLWFAGQREHGPARVGALIYLEPLVAVITGAALLGEEVTLNTLVGGACVLLGVWLVSRGSCRPAVTAGASARPSRPCESCRPED